MYDTLPMYPRAIRWGMGHRMLTGLLIVSQ